MSLGAFMGGFGKGMLIGKDLKEAWEKDEFDDAAKEGADAQTLRRISPERAEKHEARNAKFRETDANAEFADRMNASDNFAEEMRDAGGVEKWVESNVDPNATPEQKQQAVDAYRKAYQTNTGPEMARTAANPMMKLDPAKGLKYEEAWNARVKNGLMSHVGNLVNTGQMDRLATDLTDLSGVPVTISPFEADGKKGYQINAEGMEPMPFSGPLEAMTMVNLFAGRDPQAAAEAYEKLQSQHAERKIAARTRGLEEAKTLSEIRKNDAAAYEKRYGRDSVTVNEDGTISVRPGGGSRGGRGSDNKDKPYDPIAALKDLDDALGDNYDGSRPIAMSSFRQLMAANPNIFSTPAGSQKALDVALDIGNGKADFTVKVDPETDAINFVAKSGPNEMVLEADVNPDRAIALLDSYKPQKEGETPVNRREMLDKAFMEAIERREMNPKNKDQYMQAAALLQEPEAVKQIEERAAKGDPAAQRALRTMSYVKQKFELEKRQAAKEAEKSAGGSAPSGEKDDGKIPPPPPRYLDISGKQENPAWLEWTSKYDPEEYARQQKAEDEEADRAREAALLEIERRRQSAPALRPYHQQN